MSEDEGEDTPESQGAPGKDGAPKDPVTPEVEPLRDTRPKIRREIPLDLFTLDKKAKKARGILSLRRWVRLLFFLMIGAGALLWYFDARDDETPPSQRPAVTTIDKEVLRESTEAGARVRPMLGETDSMMLVVRSDPAGATLIVDGAERGETPAGLDTRCTDELPVVLELRADGYRRWRRDVPCQPGLELTFEPTLIPRR